MTYQFRLKDGSCRDWLLAKANAANFVWNYCNETNQVAWKRDRRWLSRIEFQNLTAGASREIDLHSKSIQEVCREYAKRRDAARRCKLAWRTPKRNLGWIPFNCQAVSVRGDAVTFMGRILRFWKSRPIPYDISGGSFTQDSQGRWYVNLHVSVERPRSTGERVVGVDLGLHNVAVTSCGETFVSPKATAGYALPLAKSQRARKKRQVTKIHTKIRNVRKDWAHKTTTALVKTAKQIFVGDVASSRLRKTRMAKSVQDAGWGMLKTMLEYKAKLLGVGFQVVNEKFSTVTCSTCSERTGPCGLSGLGVREWGCSACGSRHHRDVNAAKNILAVGLGHETPIKGTLDDKSRGMPTSEATID